MFFLPSDEIGEECLHGLLVSDEIVVDEIDVSAISATIDRLQLGQHLWRCFHARHSAVELDDIAKLAVERAAAGELDGEIEIVVAPEEIVTGHGSLRDIDLEFLCRESAMSLSGVPS